MGYNFGPEAKEIPTTIGEVWDALSCNLSGGSLRFAADALCGIIERRQAEQLGVDEVDHHAAVMTGRSLENILPSNKE